MFEGALDRLRCDKLSTRSLDQIFLSVSDGKKAFRVQIADVAGFEPSVRESLFCLFGTIPIAVKYRGPTHQNFAVLGDTHLHIGQWLAHRAQLVRSRFV